MSGQRNVIRPVVFACFAWFVLALGISHQKAAANWGNETRLSSPPSAMEDAQPSLDPDPFDDTAADPIHPWDNNDYSDTSTAGEPGRTRGKTAHIPLDDRVLLDTVEARRGSAVIPKEVGRLINYPNPFNAQTRIEFRLGVAGAVRLEIYNLLGQMVQRVDWPTLPAGRHDWTWDGTDMAHRSVPSGIYFARLEVGGSSALHKMVLLK